MQAGQLKNRIRLQRPNPMQAGDGSEDVTWVDVATVWAAVLPVGGRESARTNQTLAVGDTRIKMRWSSQVSAINATWRVLHGEVIYNIKAPPINTRSENIEIELICESGLNNG